MARTEYKKITIVGAGKSGKAVLEFFKNKPGVEIIIRDKQATLNMKLPKNVILRLGKNYLKNIESADEIFLSPGIPKNIPELKGLKKKISSEIKLFFDLCKAPIIGITGTNGKTTTAVLTNEIFKKANKDTFLGGNIGQSLLLQLSEIGKNSTVLLELSSFQLENLHKSPHIAVFLNFSEDHLDHHQTLGNYWKAKKNILTHQKKSDFAILNFDIPRIRNLKTPAKKLYFSAKCVLKEGAYLKENYFILKTENSEHKICSIDDIKIKGKHNFSNILAAISIAHIFGIKPGIIADAIINFPGVAHRLEMIGEFFCRAVYNDSKATTPASTISALNSFKEKVVLIAGGSDKKSNWRALAGKICQKTDHLILIGQTAPLIKKAVLEAKSKQYPQIHFSKTLGGAIKIAFENTKEGDTILFSPACASFDMFKNFEDRGDQFRALVLKFKI